MGWLSVRLGDYRSVLMMLCAIRLWAQGAGNHQIAAPFSFFRATVAEIVNNDALISSIPFLL